MGAPCWRPWVLSLPNMNTPLPSSEDLIALQEQVMSEMFDRRPGDATFKDVLTHAGDWLSSGALSPSPRHQCLSALALTELLRSSLYARLGGNLAGLIDLAQEHVSDVETGLQEGLYSAEENADLPLKVALLDAFRLCLAPEPQPHPGPTLVLVVLSSGGIVSAVTQVGRLPGALIEVIDCMDGDAGDEFMLDACWSDLVNEAFNNDVPDFVHIRSKP